MIDVTSRGESDRGWAWMILVAVTIVNLAVLPAQQCFGLIFTERFTSLGISATQTSLILHLTGTITCSLGLISGPMFKMFNFQQVAFCGGLIVTIGICTTAFALSLPAIIVTYCIVIGVGYGITFPATNLALNTYFRKKRNVAMGLSVTLTGLGPIVMPLLIAKLLENYATTGTLLILAGIATHSFVGASLLKPFAKPEITSIAKGNDITASSAECNNGGTVKRTVKLEYKNEIDVQNGVSCQLLNEKVESDATECEQLPTHNDKIENKNKQTRKTVLSIISEHLDLDLLKDSCYVAVILGMGVSLVAETNFNAMLPFVLAELSGLERNSVATVMSIQAVSDITGRLCVPLVAHKAGWTSRNLYVISLIGATLGRIILSTWGNTFIAVICVALIIGVSKGTKAVFQALIIPDYVPLERLPAASGMQMVCNGILSIAIGPIIGVVHDATNSYVSALHFTSILSLSCILLWYLGGLWKSNRDPKHLSENKDTIEVQEDPFEFGA
ncbi:monocarboxylate transporter 14 isoform X2 [Calliopsis andreniformis]|uniref:monocarboxylate transporter 14 isoform X2 n=1 Tax=Calliopsis andreniformis TaxID=337506 RepID=UPI003FCDC5F1